MNKIYHFVFILFLSISFNGCFSLAEPTVAPKAPKINMGLKSGKCFKSRHLPYNHKRLYNTTKLLLLKSKFKIINSNQEKGTMTATGHLVVYDKGVKKIVYLMNSIIIKKIDDISYMLIDTSYQTDKFPNTKNHLEESQVSFRYPLLMHKSQLGIDSFGLNHYNNYYRRFYLNIYQAMFEDDAKYYNDKY